jgi:hypothetical protein
MSWSHREIDNAVNCYEQLRRLNVLTEEIPKHIDDHRILLGIAALFDREMESAIKHFKGAMEAAQKEGKPTSAAQLGLLLCEWRVTEHGNVDRELASVISSLQKEYDSDARNEAKKSPGDARQKADKAETRPEEQSLLLRNCMLWYAVSLLYDWLRRPEESGLSQEDREALDGRLAEVKNLDPDMGDPYLIGGLIAYFFTQDDPELRKQALSELDKAVKSEVNIPEVLVLLRRERKLEELYREGLVRYLAMVKEYFRSPEVPEKLREELKAHLEQFSRFRELNEVDIVKGDDDTMPTLAGMEYRVQILRNRLDKIVRPQLNRGSPDVASHVNELMGNLSGETAALLNDAQRIEKTEQELLLTAGEFLLNEEEVVQGQEQIPESDEGNGTKD